MSLRANHPAPGGSIQSLHGSWQKPYPNEKLTKCISETCMTLNEIENVDKGLLAARYEAAVTEEFGSVAKFLELTIDEMIAQSRADGRVFAKGSKFFLRTDEIVT